jgi:hypothetical protein
VGRGRWSAYDTDRGTPFWAYASWWVRRAQLVSELTRPVVLSDRALRQLARVRDANRQVVRETRPGAGPRSARRTRRASRSTTSSPWTGRRARSTSP